MGCPDPHSGGGRRLKQVRGDLDPLLACSQYQRRYAARPLRRRLEPAKTAPARRLRLLILSSEAICHRVPHSTNQTRLVVY
jgi:hypothetical protein